MCGNSNFAPTCHASRNASVFGTNWELPLFAVVVALRPSGFSGFESSYTNCAKLAKALIFSHGSDGGGGATFFPSLLNTGGGGAPPPMAHVCFHCSANPSGLMSGSQTMRVLRSGFGILPAVKVKSGKPL